MKSTIAGGGLDTSLCDDHRLKELAARDPDIKVAKKVAEWRCCGECGGAWLCAADRAEKVWLKTDQFCG
jgi:hypothetical protein